MEDIDLERIGRRIRRLRQAKRMTQAELGFFLKVSARTVGNWERGEHSPVGSIGAIEDFFEIDDLLADVMTAGDPVATAIEQSDLTRGDKATLIGTYYTMLDAAERATGA